MNILKLIATIYSFTESCAKCGLCFSDPKCLEQHMRLKHRNYDACETDNLKNQQGNLDQKNHDEKESSRDTVSTYSSSSHLIDHDYTNKSTVVEIAYDMTIDEAKYIPRIRIPHKNDEIIEKILGADKLCRTVSTKPASNEYFIAKSPIRKFATFCGPWLCFSRYEIVSTKHRVNMRIFKFVNKHDKTYTKFVYCLYNHWGPGHVPF